MARVVIEARWRDYVVHRHARCQERNLGNRAARERLARAGDLDVTVCPTCWRLNYE